MTHLIETVTIKITLHRDRADKFPYDNLWATLKRIWQHIVPTRNMRGHINMHGIEIEWSSSGLEEVAGLDDN